MDGWMGGWMDGWMDGCMDLLDYLYTPSKDAKGHYGHWALRAYGVCDLRAVMALNAPKRSQGIKCTRAQSHEGHQCTIPFMWPCTLVAFVPLVPWCALVPLGARARVYIYKRMYIHMYIYMYNIDP